MSDSIAHPGADVHAGPACGRCASGDQVGVVGRWGAVGDEQASALGRRLLASGAQAKRKVR
jgi:hypothetical protein